MPIHGRHFDPGHGQLPILLSERCVRLDHEPACLINTNRTAGLAMRQPAALRLLPFSGVLIAWWSILGGRKFQNGCILSK